MLTRLDRHTIGQTLRARGVDAWGVAANEPRLPRAPELPCAVSVLMRIDPVVVHGMSRGPTPAYEEEYLRLNRELDAATAALTATLLAHGHAAVAVPATTSDSEAPARDGDGPFPHKTAATCAGLGWIGKTALFVSPDFGPAVRLATVFTDLDLPAGAPVTAGACGDCRACVDACPAGCGRDVTWRAGMPLTDLFDAAACRHRMAQCSGVRRDICGMCIAACPLPRRG